MANRMLFPLLLVSIVMQAVGFTYLYRELHQQAAYASDAALKATEQSAMLMSHQKREGLESDVAQFKHDLTTCADVSATRVANSELEEVLINTIKNSMHEEIEMLSAAFRHSQMIGDGGGNKFLPVRLKNEQDLDPGVMANAGQQANLVVENALDVGIWTNADNLALMKHAQNLSAETRMALISSLYGAINRQELEITGVFPAL